MNELAHINKWLYQTFTTDATLLPLTADRVYADRIPAKPIFPLISFNFQAGRDVAANGPVRIMTRPLYQIKVIVKGPLNAAASTIADRIDVIIQNTSSVVFEGLVFSARRESPLAYDEASADPELRFFHLGGVYRIDTQQVS